ncbi:glycosyl hydrolase [Marinactinospora thermotolerans]|uniref:glycosyl hydrolase n=1 Tax=Marinactinospora thermotolerans TaxID=531310 RepID=UPI003D90B72E
MRVPRSLLPRALRRATAGATVALVVAALLTPAAPAAADIITVGSGSYTTTRPAGSRGPSTESGTPAVPQVTADFDQPIVTNDWWSSLIFPRYDDARFGQNLFAHPLSYRASAGGLGIGHTPEPVIIPDGTKYEYPHTTDLTLGVAGLNASGAKVAGYGDWTVTADLSDSTRRLRTTIGQGLPFAYAEVSGGPIEVEFAAPPQVFAEQGGKLGVTVGDSHYAIFAPSSSSWTRSGTTFTADGSYASVALLPSPADFDLYAGYAYSFVTGSTLEYDHDPGAAELRTTYRVTTQAKEGDRTGTLMAMYPHQTRAATTPSTGLTYPSPRGTMTVVEGGSFSTTLTTHGILPNLPTVASADQARLRTLIDQELGAADPWKGATDTYWTGKALGRLSQLVTIADSIGYVDGRDRLLGLIRTRMEDWLTAGGDGDRAQFHYDGQWDTLTGYPASFGSDDQINDHDFHYGYFITAAATIARYDRAWISDDRWGAMVKTVLRDVANPDRDDPMFPWMRSFSPYAGHGWASGHAGFAAGNNQESSSEGLHFASATALLGSLLGDEEIRDLGVFMYTTQASAMGTYWQNQGGETFPENFGYDVVGMVWGDGGHYAIWWAGGAEELYGINYLPITAASLYLGHDPEHAAAMHLSLRERLGGEPQVWRDIHWAHLALSDGPAALARFEAQWQTYEPEAGESKAHTYQWVSTLAELGRVDTSVTADTPHYAVFEKEGRRTHVAFNAGTAPLTVTFSDGATLTVEPGRVATG